MQKTLIVLVALLGFISASSLFRSPVVELLASKQGNLTLPYNNGYKAIVDFTKDDAVNNKTMLVALYSSQTVFIKKDKCLNFAGDYACGAQYENCKFADPEVIQAITTPYFTGSGKVIQTTAWAEYYAWELQKSAPAVLADTCEPEGTKVETEKYAETNGIWGLGYDGEAKKNFINQTTNFWLSFSNSSANIQFRSNINTSPSFHEKRWSVKADGNWNVKVEKGVSVLDFKNEGVNTLIFDINHKTNGFPKAIYDGIVAAVHKIAKCDATANESPLCTDKITAKQLGNLTIQVNPTTVMNLTAYDLIQDANILQSEWTNFKLNIRALGADLSGANHVTAAAANHIIIGSRTLSRYITVFDTVDGSVTAYYSTLGEDLVKAIGSILKWIVIGIIASIVVCCLCICFCCGGTAWIVAKLGKKDTQDNYYQSSQSDPFVARK